GKQIDFRNVVLIMTTNAGAADMAKPPMGFNRQRREGEDSEAINRMFSPEFRNRLDATIAFGNLPPEVVSMVVEKFVLQLEAQLADRGVTIELTGEANQWIADRGYDDQMGARPLARLIQEEIKKPLADEVLFGKLKDGGIVRVSVGRNAAGESALEFEYLDPPAKPAKPKAGPKKKAPAKKAQTKAKPAAKAEKPKPRKGGGSVPRVPAKAD
ncbi:MAG: AAA family ATPase, partial [Rhodobiaceae bacterium]|nr:AAA family ATPase [Rhodobiaceae bacterium]